MSTPIRLLRTLYSPLQTLSSRKYRRDLNLKTITTSATTKRNITGESSLLGNEQPSAIVLLSGGLDSATVLAIAKSEGHSVITISFDYGQRHRHELQAASNISSKLGARDHRVITVDSRIFGRKHSLSSDPLAIPVPKNQDISVTKHIPSTYVPARNTLFLSYALALAESLQASDIFIGANAVDYSGYPDCRPEYFKAFQHLVNIGTKVGVEQNSSVPTVRVPLLHWSKKQIIDRGLQLGVDFAMTHSCYDPGINGEPCSTCDSCILRADAFAQLGFPVDPVVERFQRLQN